jgi:hypothetical protein
MCEKKKSIWRQKKLENVFGVQKVVHVGWFLAYFQQVFVFFNKHSFL